MPLAEFEHVVMLAIMRLGDDAFPPAILEEIEERTGRPASRGSIYVTLDRLEDKGLLSSDLRAGPSARGGRPRRYVRLTRAGEASLRESRDALLNLWDGFEERLENA